jgi:hypothetical protein
VFSFDCYLEGEYDLDVYFQKLIFYCILPVIIVGVSALFWLSVSLCKRSLNVMRNQFVTTVIVLLFLAHPTLLKYTFSAFACMELNDGEYWLLEDMEIRCFEGDHLFYALVVAAPGCLVWGIGIPTVALILVYRNRR